MAVHFSTSPSPQRNTTGLAIYTATYIVKAEGGGGGNPCGGGGGGGKHDFLTKKGKHSRDGGKRRRKICNCQAEASVGSNFDPPPRHKSVEKFD